MGFEYTNFEIEECLQKFSDNLQFRRLENDKYEIIAKLLRENNII
jgi:hypothetical protein